MPSTTENLKDAFAGESQANQKYLTFAKSAEKEGFANIAKLFRTTAAAEKIHAEGHLKALDAVGSTIDNLKAAIEGETYEYTEMYPPMYEQAAAENHKAKKMFKWALDVEEVHAQLYKLALEAASRGEDLPVGDIYLCPVCGHIEIGTPPEICPVCGAPAKMYVQI